MGDVQLLKGNYDNDGENYVLYIFSKIELFSRHIFHRSVIEITKYDRINQIKMTVVP